MLLITCPFGLSSVLTTELKRFGYKPKDVFPNGCRIDSKERKDIIHINLHTRIANKVFLEISYGLTTTFDHLFDMTQEIDRAQHIRPGQWFRITATTQHSLLDSLPTIQAIMQKSIATRLTGSPDARWDIDESIPQAEIYLYLHHNQAYITINTSWHSLHQRARRLEQGEAPMKENLAVATLLLASWPFHQTLRDPCCGSGTLVIEAARLAKNIAPGRDRAFAFQQFPSYSSELFEKLRSEAIAKEIVKPRTIIWSDIDEHIIEIAKKNAVSAWVDDVVQFYYHDIFTQTKLPALQGPTTIVCNPPYGQRLDDPKTNEIHHRLRELITQPGRNGAVISGYEDAEKIFDSSERKRKETRQWKEKCFIYIPRK